MQLLRHGSKTSEILTSRGSRQVARVDVASTSVNEALSLSLSLSIYITGRNYSPERGSESPTRVTGAESAGFARATTDRRVSLYHRNGILHFARSLLLVVVVVTAVVGLFAGD